MDSQPPTKPVHHSHWHWLYHHRRHSVGKTEKELLYGQLLSMFGAVLAGTILDSTKVTLASVIGVFVIMPGVFDLGGAVAGALAAKINHRLQEGRMKAHAVFVTSVTYALALVCVAAVFLGLFGGALATLFFHANFGQIVFITVLSSLIAGAIGLPLIGLITVACVKKGINPDNVIGPIDTSIFDSLSILAIVLVLKVFIL